MGAEEVIRKALAPRYKNQSKRDEAAAEIAEALSAEGYVLGREISTVEVIHARVPIETVEAYGLEITLDANGNAVEVTSPHGLEVAEWR